MSNVATFLMEPFDIMLHATEEGVESLQSRFVTWLRTLNAPARFLCWQMPVTLQDKIDNLNQSAQETNDPQCARLLMEYRRYMASSFDTPVIEGAFPALFDGRYEVRDTPFWHLAPLGRPGGRPF